MASTGNNPQEKRRFSRIPFDAQVLLRTAGKQWHSHLFDISLNGVLLARPEAWDGAIGEKFTLEILFEASGALIAAEIALAHADQQKIGFRIISIDVDSVAHLRRLMELNLGDEDLLNRELAALKWH